MRAFYVHVSLLVCYSITCLMICCLCHNPLTLPNHLVSLQDIAKMIKIADKSGKGGVCFADMEELMLD